MRLYIGCKLSGFTLLELMITLVVAGVLIAIAVPSYQTMMDSYRISTAINDLIGDLNYARSEATRQGQNVLVCSSRDGKTCSTSTNWTTGWVVMIPNNGSCSDITAQGGQPMRVQSQMSNLGSISLSGLASGTSGICYTRLGIVVAGGINAAKLMFAAPAAASSPNQFNQQCLFVTSTGVPHVVPYGTADAIGSC